MTLYDIVTLTILVTAIGFGYWKGLAWQIASVAAIVISYFVAYRFRGQVAQYIQAEQPWDRIGAMLIIFVACSFLIWSVYAYISRSLHQAELKGFDRQMGALVGGITGVLLCMVVTMFSVSLLGEQAHDAIHHSKLGPYVVSGIGHVGSIIPDELAQYVSPHVEKFEQQIGHGTTKPVDQYPNQLGVPIANGEGRRVFQGNYTMSPESGWAAPSTPAAPSSNWGASPVQPASQEGRGGFELPKVQVEIDSEDYLKRLRDQFFGDQ